MKFPKPKKIKDRKYLEWIKRANCIFHKSMPADDPHHLPNGKQTRRSNDLNVLPVCRVCHIWFASAEGRKIERESLVELQAIAKKFYEIYKEEKNARNKSTSV